MERGGRVVTATLPEGLAARMDEIAQHIGRSRSWIIRQAVAEWIAEEHRRYELTLEALANVDQGQTIPHDEVLGRIAERRRSRSDGA